jgi:hypothetical protein
VRLLVAAFAAVYLAARTPLVERIDTHPSRERLKRTSNPKFYRDLQSLVVL